MVTYIRSTLIYRLESSTREVLFRTMADIEAHHLPFEDRLQTLRYSLVPVKC
jgi:hypothetical protein